MDQAKPFPIFRAGTFRSMEGRDVRMTAEQLQAIADGYDGTASPAPLVVGHPQHDTPAQGWIERLSVVGDRLMAHPRQVAASFAAKVNAGEFPRVSLQFFGERDPANPKPGSLYPRHVGFLGGAAPGVTGLGTVSFADGADPDQLTTIEQDVASFAAPADPIPDPTEEEPPVADTPPNENDLATREADLAKREADLAKREKEAADARATAITESNASFAAALVASAKAPAHAKDLIAGVLNQLDGIGTVSFGANTDGLSGSGAFKKLFDSAKPLVDLNERATAETAPGAVLTISFAAPAGHTVDPHQAQIYSRANELRVANPSLTLIAAAAQAERELGAA